MDHAGDRYGVAVARNPRVDGVRLMESKSLFFDPYVGKNFGPSLLGKRVLAVGASHYCSYFRREIGCGEKCEHYNVGGRCRDFTNEITIFICRLAATACLQIIGTVGIFVVT